MDIAKVLIIWFAVMCVVMIYLLHTATRREMALHAHERSNTEQTKRQFKRYDARLRIATAVCITLGVLGLGAIFLSGLFLG